MRRIRLTILLLLCVFWIGGGMALQSKAAAGFNVLKKVTVKSTPAGKWVRNSKGCRYRCTYNGAYLKNTWIAVKKKIYYLDKKGYRAVGLKKYNGNYYFLNKKGVLKLQWKTINGKKYYFSTRTGAALVGWKNIGDLRYYFNQKGVMQTSCWVDDCYLGADGVMARNTVIDGEYVDEDGKRTVVDFEDGEPVQSNGRYIFVGDSRTIGMQNIVGGDHTYIGQVGEGYDWLTGKGSRLLKRALKAEPQSKVVINLGVNDLENIENYLVYYETLIFQYPEARFYFLSVNPIEAKLARLNGYNTDVVNNRKIQAFNERLRQTFPIAYLDSYTYLTNQNLIRNVKAGAGTVDGIHYTAEVYRAIHEFVTAQLCSDITIQTRSYGNSLACGLDCNRSDTPFAKTPTAFSRCFAHKMAFPQPK